MQLLALKKKAGSVEGFPLGFGEHKSVFASCFKRKNEEPKNDSTL